VKEGSLAGRAPWFMGTRLRRPNLSRPRSEKQRTRWEERIMTHDAERAGRACDSPRGMWDVTRRGEGRTGITPEGPWAASLVVLDGRMSVSSAPVL
jgi:hypothetical protein